MPDSAILSGLIRRMKKQGQDPLRPLVDAYLVERYRTANRHEVPPYSLQPPARPGGRFSPSDLCGCERAAAFKFVGMKGRRRVDPDQELIFDDGNWRHLKWESVFYDMQRVLGEDRIKVLAVERRVMFPELYVSGSLDAMLMLRPAKNAPRLRWVVDIKGINNRGFSYIIANGPMPKHVKQLVAYERSADCPRGLLWYENKDNQDTKAYIVRYDDDSWAEVTAWTTGVLYALNHGHLPPMHHECKRGRFMFEKCPYSRWCFGDHDDDEIRAAAYDGFVGVDAAWTAGHEPEVTT